MKKKPKRGRPQAPDPEPLECEPIPLTELEDAVKEVLLAPFPEGQHSENREPTVAELTQRYKLERRD